MTDLTTPVSDLYMVGDTYAKRLKKLEINTIEDLLHHYPFRYDDFSFISSISQLNSGEVVTIRGEIVVCQNIYTKFRKKIQKAIVADASGQIEVIWFNQHFLTQTLKPGVKVSLSGKVGYFNHKKSLVSPEYEVIKQNHQTIHTGRLVPVYPETYGISSKWLRSRVSPLIEKIIDNLPDWLPEKVKQDNDLIDLPTALKLIHFPKNLIEVDRAKKRLGFDELFLLHLNVLQKKKSWNQTKLAHPFTINQKKILEFLNRLPFQLTKDQNKVSQEILADLAENKPMNRLLEGDVGSGKTVVAGLAIFICFLNNFQSILMAPTEILANQHFKTLVTLLKPLGVKIGLLTGSKKLKSIENYDLIIGTHALIYNQVKLEKLGLVVIDEQHRFGVSQRAELIKKGHAPHILTMTATPIPRTVSLTVFGDLDLSLLEESPPGRKQVKTWVVPTKKRQAAYQWIEKQIIKNHTQVFIVCPLIDESDKDSMKNIKAAKAEFTKLTAVFKNLKLGLLHSQLKTKDKDKVINLFHDKRINILVSTPVVEVGIDIPNANIMLIEGADRFGLSQLHQLRGRVGRSNKQAYCFLFASETNKQTLKRLTAMEKYHSGFKLAEIDLNLRGPGEIYGTKQHGFMNLKIASFGNTYLVKKTRNEAEKIIGKINQFPLLKQKLKSYTMKLVVPN